VEHLRDLVFQGHFSIPNDNLGISIIAHTQRKSSKTTKLEFLLENFCETGRKTVSCSFYNDEKLGIAFRYSCCGRHNYRKNEEFANQLKTVLVSLPFGSFEEHVFDDE
jgi:hypothetical protein